MQRKLVVLLAFVLAACGQVDYGERALFSYWGKMDQECYTPGLYWYNPLWTNMDTVSVQVEKLTLQKMDAVTFDLQSIHTDITVNYSISDKECHKLIENVGFEFVKKMMVPGIEEELKAATAHFRVEKVIQERAVLSAEIVKKLRTRFEPYDIKITGIALTNFGFSPEYAAEVERKQVAEQAIQRKEYERQQAEKVAGSVIAKAEGDRRAAILTAEGEARARVLRGEAEATANRAVRDSLTKDLITFEAIKAWREGGSQVPKVSLGGNAVPFVDLGSVLEKEKGK